MFKHVCVYVCAVCAVCVCAVCVFFGGSFEEVVVLLIVLFVCFYVLCRTVLTALLVLS